MRMHSCFRCSFALALTLAIWTRPALAQVPMTPVITFGPNQSIQALELAGSNLYLSASGVLFSVEYSGSGSFELKGAIATGAPSTDRMGSSASYLVLDDGMALHAFDRGIPSDFAGDIPLDGFWGVDLTSDQICLAGALNFTLYDFSSPSQPVALDTASLSTNFEHYSQLPGANGVWLRAGQALVRRPYDVNIGDDMFPMIVNKLRYDFLDYSNPQSIVLEDSQGDENAPSPSTPLVTDDFVYRHSSSSALWWGWSHTGIPGPYFASPFSAGGPLLEAGSQLRINVEYGGADRIYLLTPDLQPSCQWVANPPVPLEDVVATTDRILWLENGSLTSRSFDCVEGLGQVEIENFGITATHAAQLGSLIFISTPDLWVLDLSDPLHVRTLGHVANVSGQPVPAENDFVYLVEGGLLRVLDVTDPNQITDYGTHDPGMTILDLASAGALTIGVAEAQGGDAEVVVLDLSNPATPTISSTLLAAAPWDPADVGGVAVHPTGYGYVGHRGDVTVVDLTNPLLPTEGITFSAGNGVQAHRVFVENDRLWTSRSRNHSVFGLQNPATPTLLTELTLADDTQPIDAVAAIPGAVCVSAGNTIQTFLVEEPFALQEVAYHVRNAASGSVAARGNLVLNVDGDVGPQLLRLGNTTATPRTAQRELSILEPNRPNPFGQSTEIRWRTDLGSPTTVRIYDLAGRLVRAWSGSKLGGGFVLWDGLDATGRSVASGVYMVSIDVVGRNDARRILKLK